MAMNKTNGSSKRSSKKTVRALTPAVRYLRYELTTSGTPGTENSHYIDLARDLSIVNRRLYRQGRDYHVKKISIVSSDTPNLGNRISVAVVPDSWVSKSAHKRAFNVWNKMNKEASENLAGDVQGTWADFKVYLSNDMRGATLPLPLDNGGNAGLLNEWVYSQMVTPDGTATADEFELHMLGDHSGAAGSRSSVGLIKSFGESRATVNNDDPTVPGDASDDPLVNVFDYGTTVDDVVDNLEFNNDRPPYDIPSYPGDELNMAKPIITQDTVIVDGRANMGSFTAMCGLLEFEIKSAIPSDTFSVLVELAAGKYRGVKSEGF